MSAPHFKNLDPTPSTGSKLVSLPANNPPAGEATIAGIVLPIKRAEELLATLPGVVSARIVAGANGAVDEIHLLTTDDVQPKSTVRNVESALLAHLGMRVSHKKISVATTSEHALKRTPPQGTVPVSAPAQPVVAQPQVTVVQAPAPVIEEIPGRKLYFEDVEVRRSRTRGVAIKVTLKKGEETFTGESEGVVADRQRIELAARAALAAITAADGDSRFLGLEGCRMLDAFDREFVFVGVTGRFNRETLLLTGSAEVKESPEQSAVLAVLDATNRWVEYARD